FYFKDEIIEDPLKLKFEYGEKWKKYLVDIYKYCQNKCDYHFNSLELKNVFEIGYKKMLFLFFHHFLKNK
ncbi:unnamed protein product, partial [marine sediment metagenome]